MSYVMFFFLCGLVFGLTAVASNPSPYFAAMGLVVVAGMGCGVLVGYGGPFLSLVLFLIYLGGMLVVFAYSAALAAEPYPENWFNGPVALSMAVYLVGVGLFAGVLSEGWFDLCSGAGEELGEFSTIRGDISGVSSMYLEGGGMLLISVWVLLLTLFVVLELTRGLGRGTLRAIY
nr:NADH dehydrogenase subunit 6 [Pseudocheilinus evanidus]